MKEITHQQIYFFEDGFRRVIPYYKEFQVNVKGRWIGKSIGEIYRSEFKYISKEEIQNQIKEEITYLINKNGIKKETTINSVIEEHDILISKCHLHEPPVPIKEIQIIENTNEYLVINKPSGIPVHPTGRYNQNCIINILLNEYHFSHLKPVYRLDKNTSGILLFAKTKTFASSFQSILKEKSSVISSTSSLQKIYLARVVGYFPDTIEVNLPLHLVRFGTESQSCICEDGIEARSSFKRLFFDKDSNTSVIECVPHTGRTHQLRLHLKAIHHPIANDSAYLLNQIHNYRQQDGEINRENKWRAKYGWVFDKDCKDCNFPKGDPIEEQIWLHAWKYSFNSHDWIAEIPEWAEVNFDAKSFIKEWKERIGIDERK
ncbi:RNA pseudouridylate synthase, putative [Entamoeba histolytica]